MTTATGPVRILIVDDSEDQLLLLQRYFERAGCETQVAASALDAQLTTEVPDTRIAITSVLSTSHYPTEHAALPKPVTGAHVRSALEQLVPRWNAA